MSGYVSSVTSPVQQPILQEQPQEAPLAPTETGVVPPEGPQAQDVQEAVDATISPDATVEERNTAYREVQAYVDRAQGSDHTLIDDATMRGIAVHVQREHNVPTKYRQEVLDAVDREISPSASLAQQAQAYEEIQRYVDGVGGIGDAGIVAEALPGRTATLLDEAGIPTLAADARADVDRIMETGVRDDWRPGNQEDDYGARFDAYTEAMRGQPEAYREHRTAALLERDPGALKSWLTPERVVEAHRNGTLDDAAFADVADTVAAAYNDGTVDADSFQRLYGIDDGQAQTREYQQLLDFLGASSSTEMQALRRDLAGDILSEWNNSPYPTDGGYHSYNFRQFNLAIQVAAGDPEHPEILTNLLASQPQETLDKIFAVAGQLPNTPPNDVMATIFDTVARDPSARGGELAATLARLPGEHKDWFAQDQVPRNEALARMVASHPEVLDALSEYDDSGARGLGNDTDRKQYEVNGRDLAAVLELTVFNPEISATAREGARTAILEYVSEQAQIVNDSRSDPNSTGYLEASGRLVVLSAASDVAVDRGFEALQADIDAKKEAIAFVVDLALAAVPLSSRLSAAAEGQIGSLFANNPLVKEALSGLSGEVIDQATGQLTDAAKTQLYANIDSDPELAALVERQTVADAFRSSILGAVANERDQADIQRDANSLADDISEID